MLLLIIYEIICSGNSAIKESIRFNQWQRPFVVAVFMMLLLSSILVRSDGIKAGRRPFWAEGIFWLGWILCFGGILYANSFNEASPNYMLWSYLSLSIIPVIWCMWSSYPGGQRDLVIVIAKAMVVGSYICVFLHFILTPFIERKPIAPLFEFIGFTSHPNTNGIMCGGFAIAAAFLLMEEKRCRMINVVAFALSLSGIIASNCRSAELGMMLALSCGIVYYLRRRGLPARINIGKSLIYLILIISLCAASVISLRYIDHIYVAWDSEQSQMMVKDTTYELKEDDRKMAEAANDETPIENMHNAEENLYDRINRISSDRLTIWNTYIPLITSLGKGKISGPLNDSNPASYSAHNNAIEILYTSGYLAGAGYIIWALCCLLYIGYSLFAGGTYRLQSLFFMMSFLMFFSISMLDVMQYPFHRTASVMTYLSLGVVAFRRKATSTIYRIIKRLFDIGIATIGLVLLIPVAIFIKIGQVITDDRGPLFYTQTRIGLRGKAFKLYKFRTMNVDADSILDELLKDREYREQWISRQKLDDDPRVTKTGKILRKTSVDELPQLLNVLKGDMSLIGPRPLVPGELEEHKGRPWIYNKIRPGMTGWWICHGHNNTNYKKRLELEYYYVLNCSPAIDVMCFLKTLLLITRKKADVKDDPAWKKAYEASPTQNNTLRISVIIPTLNGEEKLSALLSSLRRQDVKPDEIIVVDSSSTDNTRKICENDPAVRLIEIRREDFNHGGTRDLALKKSSGDIIVFLTQDATPKGTDFLEELVAPFVMDDVAVSSGRQIARRNASESERLIREYNYPGRSFLRSKKDIDDLGIKAFFTSNVCAAYRRDIYEKLGGFERNLKTNEDMFFAAKAINSGYKIAYAADAEVYHSHNLSWREQYERNRIQGYEISRHKDLLGGVSSEAEGFKMVSTVALNLIVRCRFISLVEFTFDCIARYMGSRKG